MGTKEPQYNNDLALRDRQGLTSLGLMTNQVWHEDPRRLIFLLSRYKFVSKMLKGKKNVLEVGCGDGFGGRVVSQEVEKLTLLDFEPHFIEDIQQRMDPKWPVELILHNLLDGAIEGEFDAIYSLDVLEHIKEEDEYTFLANAFKALTPNGVAIFGMPSIHSQDYASPGSKAGHVNCKNEEELRVTFGSFFENVFIFSMNDEVVHTGFTPMAHYLIILATNRKK